MTEGFDLSNWKNGLPCYWDGKRQGREKLPRRQDYGSGHVSFEMLLRPSKAVKRLVEHMGLEFRGEVQATDTKLGTLSVSHKRYLKHQN